MSVGTSYTRSDIDRVAGTLACQSRALMADANLFKGWLDTQTPSDLLAIGYTQPEVDLLVSSFSTVDGIGLLALIYQGAAALPTPIDFSTMITRLSGPAPR